MKKRILSMVLLFSILSALLCSCKDDAEGDTEDSATEAPTEDPALALIVTDGATDYRVLYNPADTSDMLNSRLTSLINAFDKKFGVKIEKKSCRMVSYNANVYEICVGINDYPEIAEQAAALREKDYFVLRSGNKIFLCGGCPDATANAVNWFINNQINEQAKAGGTLSFGTADNFFHSGTYTAESVKIFGTELLNFKIVIPFSYTFSEHETASILRDRIHTACGFLPEIITDAKSADHEIRIGNTKRSSETPGVCEYVLDITDGVIQLSSGSTSGYLAAEEAFEKLLLSKSVEINEHYRDEADLTAKFTSAKDSVTGPTGDLRVIYHNVYGYNYPTTGKDTFPALRYRLESELYKEYAADVVCLQEFSTKGGTSAARSASSGLFKWITAKGYAEIPFTGTDNLTPIFYNPDRVTPVKYGFFAFPDSYDNTAYNEISKGFTWAIMTEKETKKNFLILSIHFDHQDTSEANARRATEASQLLTELKTNILTGEYASLPVIIGGDLNTCYTREEDKYGNVGALKTLTGGGFTDIQPTLATADKRSSYCGYAFYDASLEYYTQMGTQSGSQRDSIDHCMVKGAVTPILFDVLDSLAARKASDHMALVIDFNLD